MKKESEESEDRTTCSQAEQGPNHVKQTNMPMSQTMRQPKNALRQNHLEYISLTGAYSASTEWIAARTHPQLIRYRCLGMAH